MKFDTQLLLAAVVLVAVIISVVYATKKTTPKKKRIKTTKSKVEATTEEEETTKPIESGTIETQIITTQNAISSVVPASKPTPIPVPILNREYTFYKGFDMVGQDLVKEEGTVEELKQKCDKYGEKCKGFTTSGWLKSFLDPFSNWIKSTDNTDNGFYKVKDEILPLPYLGPKYLKTKSKGVWAADAFKCDGAFGRNVTGGNGDYANYCMFDQMKDANLYCNQDKDCKGIIESPTEPKVYVATRQKPVPNDVANGAFYSKHSFVKFIHDGVWAADAFKCDGATGRNVTGNNNDYANYCMFDTFVDAEKYCDTDNNCRGLLYNGDAIQVTRTDPVPNPVANGSFYVRK